MSEIKVTGGYPYKVVPVDGYSGVPVGGNPASGGTPVFADIIGRSNRILVTPTLTVHATYVANDYVGTSGVCMRFVGAARVLGGTGYIQSAVLIDYALQSVAAELWLFDDAVTPPNDSAAWTLSDADMLKWIGTIPFSTYYPSAVNSGSRYEGYPIGFKCMVGSMDIFGCLVTRGAPALASGDYSVKIVTLQD